MKLISGLSLIVRFTELEMPVDALLEVALHLIGQILLPEPSFELTLKDTLQVSFTAKFPQE